MTVALGSRVRTVTLDGRHLHHVSVRASDRGLELTVPVPRAGRDGGPHTLVVTVR